MGEEASEVGGREVRVVRGLWSLPTWESGGSVDASEYSSCKRERKADLKVER